MWSENKSLPPLAPSLFLLFHSALPWYNDDMTSGEARGMSDEELARENVVAFTYMCGYTPSQLWRSVHAGEFDTKEEAIEAELEWLQQPAE